MNITQPRKCMRPVAIVAAEDFSPFHFSVPCIMFSEKAAAMHLPSRRAYRRGGRFSVPGDLASTF